MKLTPRVIILFALAFCFIALGSLGILQGLDHRSPRVTPISQFIKSKPSRGWYRVTGGTLDMHGSVWLADWDNGNEDPQSDDMYVPILVKCPYDAEGYSIDPENPEPVKVMVQITDPGMRALVAELYKVQDDEKAHPEAFEKYFLKKGKALFPQLNVEGVIQYGYGLDDETRKAMRDYDKTIVADFVVIRQNLRPASLWVFFIVLGAGFLIGIAGVAVGVNAKRRKI
jgi:hypothetical protein